MVGMKKDLNISLPAKAYDSADCDPNLRTKWHLRGLYLDSCNCDWGCPYQFNARPTHGSCEELFGIHIKDGNYGNVKLDTLN
jgi:hypothetical protein